MSDASAFSGRRLMWHAFLGADVCGNFGRLCMKCSCDSRRDGRAVAFSGCLGLCYGQRALAEEASLFDEFYD